MTVIVTPLYVSVVEVAPASWSVVAAQAVALAASLTLARARNARRRGVGIPSAGVRR